MASAREDVAVLCRQDGWRQAHDTHAHRVHYRRACRESQGGCGEGVREDLRGLWEGNQGQEVGVVQDMQGHVENGSAAYTENRFYR